MHNDKLTVQSMDSSIYNKLQNDFVMIRFLHCGIVNDTESLNNAKNNIIMIRSVIEEMQGENSHNLLVYCIDTLLEIIQENNREKTFDFADLIHNMPEIYLGKRSIMSFKRGIRAFNKKYKANYFIEFIRFFSPKNI